MAMRRWPSLLTLLTEAVSLFETEFQIEEPMVL